MSTQLITRSTTGGLGVSVKDEPLTSFEIDSNFISLKNNKLEIDNNLSDITDAAAARNSINVPSTNGSNAFGTWSISITGNSGTATNLQNPVNIQGVSFDGSQDIDIITGIVSSGFGISNFPDWDLNANLEIAVNDQEIVTVATEQTITGQKTFSDPVILSSEGTEVNHAVRADRQVVAGDGLSGGGSLDSDVTLNIELKILDVNGTQVFP